MSLALAVVPVLSFLALLLLYFVFASLRSVQIAKLKQEHERFTRHALEHDEALQRSLMDELLLGNAPADRLNEFQRQRASILPAVRLDNPAAWDVEDLTGYAQRKLSGQLAELNRKLGVASGAISVGIVGLAMVCGAILYNFRAGPSSAESAPAGAAFSGPSLASAVNPLSDQALAPDGTARAGLSSNADGTTPQGDDGRDASSSASESHSSKTPN